MGEYIDREELLRTVIQDRRFVFCMQDMLRDEFVIEIVYKDLTDTVNSIPAADVVEVVSGYHKGDVCIYGYGAENKSRAIVEIVRILNDERGVAEVKFLKVFVDDTGNGLFDYLLKSGKTMNASFQYLKNITPRMEGEVI